MTTISVPLDETLLRNLDALVSDGVASNRADAMRKALKKYAEDQAVESVLRAQKEPSLRGDLDELAKKFR